jgi:hypothetical protein
VIFALTEKGRLQGTVYPAISTDSGKQWRIDGPVFYYANATDGAGATTSLGAGAPDFAYAWGENGNFVKVTADGGGQWWETSFGYGVKSVKMTHGALSARAYGSKGLTTFVYASVDHGRTWVFKGSA